MAEVIRCHHLKGAPDCCSSCHDDEEAGFDCLQDMELGDGREVRACCAVMAWVEEDLSRVPAAAAAP